MASATGARGVFFGVCSAGAALAFGVRAGGFGLVAPRPRRLGPRRPRQPARLHALPLLGRSYRRCDRRRDLGEQAAAACSAAGAGSACFGGYRRRNRLFHRPV